MDHQSALNRNTTERYVLGELDAAEVAEFEEHFFACAACAEDVRRISLLVANVKAVLREEDANRVIEIGPNDKFVTLTIGVKTEASLICEIQCGTELAPIVVEGAPSGGSVHLHLPASVLAAGPCTVVLRSQGSRRELERRTFIVSKISPQT